MIRDTRIQRSKRSYFGLKQGVGKGRKRRRWDVIDNNGARPGGREESWRNTMWGVAQRLKKPAPVAILEGDNTVLSTSDRTAKPVVCQPESCKMSCQKAQFHNLGRPAYTVWARR